MRLDEQLCLFHLDISLDRVELLIWLIATKCLFQQLGLGVAAWEVNEDPASGAFRIHLLLLVLERVLLGSQRFNLLGLEPLLLKLFLNFGEPLVDLHLP